MSRPPISHLGSLIGLPSFGSQSRDQPPADPPVSTLVEVNLDQIDLYDLNPRRQDNAVYERLRESIRVNGLDNPIPITRRPGTERYIVAAGGNTRLKALRELYQQTGEAKFSQVPCLFKPFTSDLDILAAHLRENDLRDELVFIDHAMAIQTLKGMLEESGGQPLNRSEFERRLLALGHPISRRDLGRMEYAVVVLYPVIPQALQHGAGPRLIDRLGVLEGAYRKYYDDLPEPRPAFTPLFEDVLSLCDGPVLDLEAVRTNLDHRIAEATQIPAHRVRLGVEAELAVTGRGGSGRATDASHATAAGVITSFQSPADEQASSTHPQAGPLGINHVGPWRPEGRDSTGTVSPANPVMENAFSDQEAPVLDGEPERLRVAEALRDIPKVLAPQDATPVLGERIDAGEHALEIAPAQERVAPIPRGVVGQDHINPSTYLNPWLEGGREYLPRLDDLKSLRNRTYVLATQLAQTAGLQALVQPDRDAPAGFVLHDLAAEASESETLLWWVLAALSGTKEFDQVPRDHACLGDPAAFVWQGLLRFEAGHPPSDSLLRQLCLLLEAIVALARARDGTAESA